MPFSDSSDANVVDAPGFFEVKSRSGDPSTEELHARTSRVKVGKGCDGSFARYERFNNGHSYALRGIRGSDATHPPFLASTTHGFSSPSAVVRETDTHAVVRAKAMPAIAAAAASSARSCSGKVLSHGWAFLCADGAVFAWEQGMITTERPAAVAHADQVCLRFDHPSLIQDLEAAARALVAAAVSVKAADVVVLTQAWKALGGKRELLLMSPGGLARYWPDLHSPRRFTDIDARSVAPGQWITRAVSLGPADFLCGLSNGGVLRLRPGIAQPCLLAESSSSVFSFSTIKRVGTFIGQRTFSSSDPAPPLGGTTAQSPSAATPSPVVSLSVVQPWEGENNDPSSVTPSSCSALVLRLTVDALEVWRVPVGAGVGTGIDTLEVRRSLLGDVQEALGGRRATLSDLAVAGFVADEFQGGAGKSSPRWVLELLVLAVAMDEETRPGIPKGPFSVHCVRVSPGAGGHWMSHSASVQIISSHAVAEELPIPSVGAGVVPRASLVIDKEAFLPGDGCSSLPVSRSCYGMGEKELFAHVFWATPSAVGVWSMVQARDAGGQMAWISQGTVEVSTSVELLGSCVGGGACLHGCPGVVLLSARGKTLWVAQRQSGGRAVDLDYPGFPKYSSRMAAEAWRFALLDAGLKSLEAGGTMDAARSEVEVMLRNLRSSGDRGATIFGDLNAAIAEAGREVLDGRGQHSPAFACRRKLVHLALRDKARLHRCLVRFIMDAGAWGLSSIGRAALAEGGEKIAAAARLCELQEANSVGARASRLLEECFRLSLLRRNEAGVSNGDGNGAAEEIRDRYFEQTYGVLDALVELHTPSPVDTPSASIDGATATPLERAMKDHSLGNGEMLGLLNQTSIVVAGVFEAALRHRACERSVYRAGVRGNLWTVSTRSRRVLRKQLEAYEARGLAVTSIRDRADRDIMRGVIGRLSVLLLDGFVDEAEANPEVSGRADREGEYVEAKDLCVRVLASCGREDLARSLADKHTYYEGTIRLCHEAELQQPGCLNGHSLLKGRMQPPPTPSGAPDSLDHVEFTADCKERERFAHVVLDWHLRRGLKTSVLDLGEVVPSILAEFLADWKEAELLWMSEIRRGDLTGARWTLLRGSPPADQRHGRLETQHLWLSLAKLVHQAGAADATDSVMAKDIQPRLELMEVRERLISFVPTNCTTFDMNVADDSRPWTWQTAVRACIDLLISWSLLASEEHSELTVHEVADVAYQGYKALVVGLPEASYELANALWREVIGLTLRDSALGEALAKGTGLFAARNANTSTASDREMEVLWKRPTALHLLLRAISKARVRRKEMPWAGVRVGGEEGEIELTDQSLVKIVTELIPTEVDGNGVSPERWVAAIRKCPW